MKRGLGCSNDDKSQDSDLQEEEEEEEDYMNESFLAEAEKHSTAVGSRRKRVKNTEKGFIKPKQVLELEEIDSNLNLPGLSQTNKGFLLLSKMGYKPGTSLGPKDKQNIIEPISIDLKYGNFDQDVY